MTDRSVRALVAGRARIRFFASSHIAAAPVQEVKTPTGTMRVSTPETTAVDLVRFARSAGYLDHVAAIIAELSSSLRPDPLLTAVRRVGDVPTAQRLGHILDHIGADRLADALYAWIEQQAHRAIPLRPGRTVPHAPEDRKWRVRVDEPLAVDA